MNPTANPSTGIPPSQQMQQSNGCNFFEGSWVYDSSYPIFNSSSCPFIGEGFDCQKNGRPDKDYLKYRWKPSGCDIPRFNGVDFLERNRGKKMMFVGDSLSYNMWVSLSCMLHSAVPNSKYTISLTATISTFSIPEYSFSAAFLKNGFLVDLVYEKIGRVLKLDSISSGNQWIGADILIFNSFHWWTHTGKLKTWDYFEVGGKLFEEMDRMEAYKIALTTWAKWIDANIDPSKIRLFFQGVAAVHPDGKEWGDPKAKNCLGQTQPLLGSKYPGPSSPGEGIVKSVLSNMEKPAKLLDITLLTQLRKDGHQSLYTGQGKGLVDCSHWCVAGVPDTWNQLLYAALID